MCANEGVVHSANPVTWYLKFFCLLGCTCSWTLTFACRAMLARATLFIGVKLTQSHFHLESRVGLGGGVFVTLGIVARGECSWQPIRDAQPCILFVTRSEATVCARERVIDSANAVMRVNKQSHIGTGVVCHSTGKLFACLDKLGTCTLIFACSSVLAQEAFCAFAKLIKLWLKLFCFSLRTSFN